MKISTVLIALALGGCAYQPTFPYETGAPPRPPIAGQKLLVLETSLTALRPSGKQEVGHTVATPQTCVILIARELNAGDRAYVLTHEERHCTGQVHRRVYRPDGSWYLEWLP